jgi:cation:H+ antiporter
VIESLTYDVSRNNGSFRVLSVDPPPANALPPHVIMHPLVLPSFKVLVGFVALVIGGELLVRGASGLASLLKISSLVIGLTVVAFGTSAPELAVSVQSSFNGKSELAIGNVVGSNIFNVLGILGCSALIAPLVVSRQLIRFDVPIMVAASFLALGVSYDGNISRAEGAVLFLLIVMYTSWLILQSRHDSKRIDAEEARIAEELASDVEEIPGLLSPDTKPSGVLLFRLAGFIIAGLVLLSVGSSVLVDGASTLATAFGVSELMIGLTIVAIGTSLPEAATSFTASIRGERDIAVGNVVGSNIFNIFSVLGLSAVVSSKGLPVSQTAIDFDIPVMIAVAIACAPVFITRREISRWEGALFMFYYVIYTVYLILTSGGKSLASWFETLMWIAFPLTAVVIIGSLVAEFRSSPPSDTESAS